VKQPAERPKVVIVIPTLGDRLVFLKQTLESIANQGENVADIILVCPKDSKARSLAKKYKAIVVNDKGAGISSALNEGFKAAKPWHKYGGWMGDDDMLRPGMISKTVSVLEANPKSVLAFGYCDYIDNDGQTLFTSRAGRFAPWIMRWGPNLLPLPGLIYRLDAGKKAGGYDETLKYSMDLDMWLKIRRYGNFINTRRTLGAFRWHDSSTTVANRNLSLDEAQKVKRRYMSNFTRLLAPLWEWAVKIATRLAVRRVNALRDS
jgi:glycosyltransferase involved in cell wall biosynthesis